MEGVPCDRTSATTRIINGLCYSHHRHRLLGREPGPIRPKRSVKEIEQAKKSGEAYCKACQKTLPLTNFELSKTGTPRVTCHDCKAAEHVYRMYKLTPDDMLQLLQIQGNRCALCRASDAGYGRRWHIDHDHTCCPGERSCGKCVRSALCLTCNARGLPWYEGLPKEMQTIEAINEYLVNPPGLRLVRKEAP
ncbi:endonuclease VII [Streptomyces phage Ibantik]|uniref:Endonuclease VII n=1 Tax=Streptomyces phage Ibantik TaxID=2182397 RepID=A0A2U8UNY7_9CAUD|nr:endonuclease VII [Streptomyces phage Ibantik]AWN05290.1 endonuclease VII [Streptomyces phage Ibantik]